MTTEDWPTLADGRVREVTTLPDRGTVLVRSAGPPRLPADRCVDVRPGAFAAFDGDRHRLPLAVTCGDERRWYDRSELPEIEDAVTAALGGRRPTVDGGNRSAGVDGGERAILRFGDRAACRRMLPLPAVDAIERRLGVAAGRAAAAFVTWTSGDPRSAAGGTYDVVLDPPARSE